jgi:hypothetical protein
MTYWPISSPSVFAATKHANPESTRVSNDGVEAGQDERDGSPQKQAGDEAAQQGANGVKEERPPHRRASEQTVEDDINGEIIAIRVTRSGHMFATLTRSTLTIWQTKACLQSCAVGPVADAFHSQPLS